MIKILHRLLPLILLVCLSPLARAEPNPPIATVPADSACEQLGRDLAGLFNQGDPTKMADFLDLAAFTHRSFKGLELSAKERNEFAREFSTSFTTSLRTWKKARFVRVFTQGGEKRILMRVISEEGAFNFFEWVCAPKTGGGVKTVDLLTYLTGELISETSRRAVLPLLAEREKGFLERLTQGESAIVKSMPQMQKGLEVFRAGKPAEAMALLEKLPTEVKQTPVCLMLRLQAAQGSGNDEAYLRVITDWETARPGDPALDTVSIDGHLMRKDFARCIQSITTVQKRVGGDGYLQALKANVYNMAGEPAKARAAIREAVTQEPNLANSYDIWFSLELQEKNWAGMVEALTAFETAFPAADIWEGIKGEVTWAPFCKSAECKAWLEKRAAKKTGAETN